MANQIEYIKDSDLLFQGTKKINDFAIDPANRAEAKSDNAVGISNQTRSQVISVQGQANAIQQQVDDLVLESGDSTPEVVQARDGYPLLKDKLNRSDELINGFFQKILASSTKIKLIGDSITAGVGATGHHIPEDNPIIFDNGSEVFREADYESPSWANAFRKYINKNYPALGFVNAGIGGKSTRWAMTGENKSFWVDEHEDITFVMLGMNDRSLGDFETNIRAFLKYVDEHSNYMIVMVPNATLNDDPSLNVEVRTINDTIIRVCQENNYFVISHFIGMLEYMDNSAVSINALVQTNGGSHPVDLGYAWMWRNIQQKLKFIDNQMGFNRGGEYETLLRRRLAMNFATSTKKITEFPFGFSTCIIQSSSTGQFGLPDNAGAVVNTYRDTSSGKGYNYQEIVQYGTNYTFRRTVKDDGGWTEYLSDSRSRTATVTAVFTEIGGGKVGTANVSLSSQVGLTLLKDKYAVSVMLNSVVDNNLFFTACLDDNGRFLYVRLFNAYQSPLNPGTLKIDIVYTRK